MAKKKKPVSSQEHTGEGRPGSAYNRQTHYDILNEVSGLKVKPFKSQEKLQKKKKKKK